MATEDQLLDYLQMAVNSGAFICPLAGQAKPKDHQSFCVACRVRGLMGERFIAPETEMLDRAVNHAASHRYVLVS